MKGIIFDCDGTLLDSLGQAMQSFNHALDEIGEPPRSEQAIKRYFGQAADRIFLNFLNGDEKRADAAFTAYLDHQLELAKSTKLHTGVRELLDQLEEEGVPLGIVTGRHARDLEIVLRPHEISDRFICLVADSHLPKSKPAPDGILLAARNMDLAPAQTLYVGDSTMDIRAAHAAGSIPVAALWDQLTKSEEMQKERPEFMAKMPQDVWTFYKGRRDTSGLNG